MHTKIENRKKNDHEFTPFSLVKKKKKTARCDEG